MKDLRSNWYSRQNIDDFDLNGPGIYEWRIQDVGIYVGKAAVLRNRITAYPRNVRAMLNGRPWHGNASRSYRPIHHALRHAHDLGTAVTVTILENCSLLERLERERWWISKRREEEAAGGPRVLNA